MGLVAFAAVGGCIRPDVTSGPTLRTAAYAGQAAIDEVLREVGSLTLEQDSSHPIGGIRDLAVDSAGRVYLADTQMRELKAWDADGSFVGVLGYALPASVA